MFDEAIKVGKLLAKYGLIDGASGNMSFVEKDKIVITKTGECLDELKEDSFVILDFDEESSEASSDLIVHREVYINTDFRAIVHCHGVFNVVLSLKFDRIEPLDLEAKIYFGHIPVVEGFFGTKELAEKIATAIKGRGAVIVKGHGIYAAGENLRDAFNKAAYVEHSCEVKYRSLVLDKL